MKDDGDKAARTTLAPWTGQKCETCSGDTDGQASGTARDADPSRRICPTRIF
jgi:hypothetical protein